MNIAFHGQPDHSPLAQPMIRCGGRIARLDIIGNFQDAEVAWRKLERDQTLFTAYQRYDWARLWQSHVGIHKGMTPFLVLARDTDGAPLFLLPFARARMGGVNVARFFGGKHANINFALWQRHIAAAMTAADMRAILDHIGAANHGIDLLMLVNQPRTWAGIANPFALLPHQHAIEDNHVLTLGAPGEDVLRQLFGTAARGKLRTKERKLAQLDGYRYTRAATAHDIDRYLDAFFHQKAARLAAQGIANVFAEPGVEDFVRAACRCDLADGKPLIEVHVIEGGGEVLALFSGVANGHRFSSMFNSYSLTENARWSPGTILLLHLIANCADRGLGSFDLGLGEAPYKSLFCKETEPLFDSFLPLSPKGHAAALAARTAYAMKRWIKRSPRLWGAIQTTRRRAGARQRSNPRYDQD